MYEVNVMVEVKNASRNEKEKRTDNKFEEMRSLDSSSSKEGDI